MREKKLFLWSKTVASGKEEDEDDGNERKL